METYTYRVWPDGSWEFEDDFTDKCEKYDDYSEITFTQEEVGIINDDEELLYASFVKAGLC